MRALWSEKTKRIYWRKVWAALARVSAEFSLIHPDQAEDIQAHAEEIDLPKALALEKELRHDLMAELVVFAAQCPIGGGVIHLGATSMDIEDNAEALRQREALGILLNRMSHLLRAFSKQIQLYAGTPVIGYTHLQPAEPTTLGYRLAFYAQDLLIRYNEISRFQQELKGKGFKGAVGTGASYCELLGAERFPKFEARLSQVLGLPFFQITHQTYPRGQDYRLISLLAAAAIPLAKFAHDLRILQNPSIAEWQEPFAAHQVGSSAMPFKRNPITAEKINSLARWLAALPAVAWENAANSFLERTLDDSANRRAILPEACLLLDELLTSSIRLVEDLQVNLNDLQTNLERYAPFAAVEKILLALTHAGMDRNSAHEHLRQLSMQAWDLLRQGKPNPLQDICLQDALIVSKLSTAQIMDCFDIAAYIGIGKSAALHLASQIEAQTG